MGSTSDWDTMCHTAEVLERFNVPFEKEVVSAHRTPVWMAEFAQGAEARGIQVIIAGAGGAAHLPGHGRVAHGAAGARRAGAERVAAGPRLAAVDRADARRRAGRHARDRQGRRDQRGPARRRHPGHDASRNCASGFASFAPSRPPRSGRTRSREPHRAARRHHRRAGQRTAGPHVRARSAAHGLPRPHALAGRRHADRPGRGSRSQRRVRRHRRDSHVRPRRRRDDVRVRERLDRCGRCRGGDRGGASERIGAAHHAAARAREGVSRRSRLSGDAVREGAVARRAGGRPRRRSACRRSSRPRHSATTARASTASIASRTASACGG